MMEEELVPLALEGDENAYRELFERNFSRMFRVALGYVGASHDEAKDICQGAFIKAFDRLDTLDDPCKFRSWLTSVVSHL